MTSKCFEVIMPQLGANDDVVKVTEWRAKPAERVARGQPLASLETSKATVELESEEDGFLYPLVKPGIEVAVRRVIAIILPEPDADFASRYADALGATDREKRMSQDGVAGELMLTARARQLVEQHNVDLSLLPSNRIVRESDVLVVLKGATDFGHTDLLRRVVVYGASQGGLAVWECLMAMGGYEVVAFLDDTPGLAGSVHRGLPVWPGDDMEHLRPRRVGAVASHIANRGFRLSLVERAQAAGVVLLNVIHPRAYVAQSARMGAGNLIKAGAILDAEAQIGDCCIVDNGAIVAHHNVLGNACHIAPGACLAGDCRIGDQTLVGVGATIAPRIAVGRNVIIGVGACVVRDVPDNVVVEGCPARIVGDRR